MTQCLSPSRRPRALIVEDEVLIALGLEADLNELGFEVCGLAPNATGAVSLAIQDAPDIAVVEHLSQWRPRRYRDRKTAPRVVRRHVVFVTAYNDEEGLVERIWQQVPGAPVLSNPL